jgi:LysM repeat protein
MRFDLRPVLTSILALVLTVAGCTRARVSDTANIPAVSIASVSNAAVAGVPRVKESEAVAAPATTQNLVTIFLAPGNATIAAGETVNVDIRIQDADNLFGADVRLKFDPDIIEVVDANTLIPGIQITSGDFPDFSEGKGFVAQNTVDADEGSIGYAMSLLSPAEPVSGSGRLASITFRGQSSGTTDISFTTVLLSNTKANQIPSERIGGSITVAGKVMPTDTPAPAPTDTPASAPAPSLPSSPSEQCVYTVKPDDTLFSIASQFGTTVSQIAQANGLTNVNEIQAGQNLVIPGCEPGVDAKPSSPQSDRCFTYIVEPADTLFSIAQRFGVGMDDITFENNIVNPSLIFEGQQLTICPSGDSPSLAPESPTGCTHSKIRPGDTLFSIAVQFDTTVQIIQDANNITDPNLIFEGLELCIPN